MSKNNYHVVPRKQGGWGVKKERSSQNSAVKPTQKQAEKTAKEFLKNIGGEVKIHGRDGKIRDSDTVPPAKDPKPPKDIKH